MQVTYTLVARTIRLYTIYYALHRRSSHEGTHATTPYLHAYKSIKGQDVWGKLMCPVVHKPNTVYTSMQDTYTQSIQIQYTTTTQSIKYYVLGSSSIYIPSSPPSFNIISELCEW